MEGMDHKKGKKADTGGRFKQHTACMGTAMSALSAHDVFWSIAIASGRVDHDPDLEESHCGVSPCGRSYLQP